ncbi:hypothetical protein ACLB2K_016518 [Fragaria x ananassa]
MTDMLQDAFEFHDHMIMPSSSETIGGQDSSPSIDVQKFNKLLDDANTDLFQGARVKKLELLVRLYKIKCSHSNSDTSFEETLDLLRDTFPIRKDHEKDQVCEHCGTSRWTKNENGNEVDGKPKAAKTLRYFPLAPRLQRLYMSRHTAYDMSWHSKLQTKDKILRHPANSLAWAQLDEKFPNFGNECHNVRLELKVWAATSSKRKLTINLGYKLVFGESAGKRKLTIEVWCPPGKRNSIVGT